jgi:transmembrane sensor
MESNRLALEDRAAAWLQKRDLGPWGEADNAELGEWLEHSTAHRVTFLRLEAAWEEVARLKAVAPGFARETVPTPEQLRLTQVPGTSQGAARSVSGKRRHWAMAAAIVLTVSGAGLAYWQSLGSWYRTPTGGLASVPLEDGSTVTLNTASRVRIQMTSAQRRVELAEGEAFFDIAHDPARPFVVVTDDRAVTVLGTAFSVRREGTDLHVIVAEGKVRLEDASSTPDPRQNAVLTAGSVAHASVTGLAVTERSLTDIDDALSWRTGYLVFHDTALPGVVAEFNRYNERKIVIEDNAVNSIELTGKFRSSNIDALVRLLEGSFHVTVRRERNRILLSE